MDILFSYAWIGRFGEWFRAYHFARHLVQRGHRVTILKLSEARYALHIRHEDGIQIVETPRLGGMQLFGGFALPSDILARILYISAHHWDVVHVFSHHFNGFATWQASRALRRAKVHVFDWCDLWTEQGGPHDYQMASGLKKIWGRWERYMEVGSKPGAEGITVTSQYLKKRALEVGVQAGRVLQLPNGADTRRMVLIDKQVARRSLRLDEADTILIYVGFARWDNSSDLELMFGAVFQLVNFIPGIKLLMVGADADLIRPYCERWPSLQGHVLAYPRVPFLELGNYLSAADVGLIPYGDNPGNAAGWPSKLGDYLAAGIPIVATQVGEMSRLLTRYSIGLLSHPDPISFANKIAELIGNPQGCLQFSTNARLLAATDLSWDGVTTSLEAFYHKLLAQKSQ